MDLNEIGKENDDKFWYIERKFTELYEIVHILEERIRELQGPPIPKPNPKHTPGRVELREMLISACKDVYSYWPRNADELNRYEVFTTYMKAKGYDYKKDLRPELWPLTHEFKNHELQEALRILGVME